MNPITLVVGPLAAPECIRTARRGWVLLARALAGFVLAVPSLGALWWWWMRAEVQPDFRGDQVVAWGLAATTGLSVALAILLAPALLAGSLAGERERGSIGLLLSTRVDCREIVLGRLVGKLSILATMLLAGWPFLIFFAILRDLGPMGLLALLALPFVVAFGAGGIAVAVSSVARKGWNALMVLYLAEIVLLLIPLLGLIPALSGMRGVLDALNPFGAIGPAVASTSAAPAAVTLAIWTAFGTMGSAFAAWRLRPSFLASVAGASRRGGRRRVVPPVAADRPMLWKELFIERAAALGIFGRLLGTGLIAYLVLGSLASAGLVAYHTWIVPDAARLDRATVLMGQMYEGTGDLFAILLQLAVALRAAVAISSERERGTWEALLTSPLTGREILVGKLWGSLYALRWLFLATFLAWGLSVACGAMHVRDLVRLLLEVGVVGLFAAAVGVRASMTCRTATRAMTLTVVAWVAALAGLSLLMAICTLALGLLAMTAWMVAAPLGLVPAGSRPWFAFPSFGLVWGVLMASSYLSLALTVVTEAWARFDAVCGRMAGDGRERPTTPPPWEAEPVERVAVLDAV